VPVYHVNISVFSSHRNSCSSVFGWCSSAGSSGHRRLWSADIDICIIPWANAHLVDRNFAVAGPCLQNSSSS